MNRLLLILGIAAVLLLGTSGVLTFQLLQEKERSEALEAANRIYEKDLTAMQEKNVQAIDSLQQLKTHRENEIEIRDLQINEIISYVDKILNTSPNEKAIDTIRDLDSITELFARYYPDKQRTGQGSD